MRHKSSIRKMNEFYGINAHLSRSGRAGDAPLERLLAGTEGGYGGRVSLDSLVGESTGSDGSSRQSWATTSGRGRVGCGLVA